SNVVVTDDNGTPTNLADDFNPTFTGGDANSNGLLDVGETWTYTASATVTAGQYKNIRTASAKDPNNVPVTSTDPAYYFGATPSIKIVKSVNGRDANSAPGPILEAGSTATFTYVVTNSGNIALSTVVVTDDNGTPANLADAFHPTFTGGDTN